jgi:hypothetical protein
MSLINDIDVNTIEKININKERIFNYKIQDINNSLPQAPPVTLTIGSPIINLPGCIKYNITNKKSNELIEEDERGNRVLCDANMPTYDPMDYRASDFLEPKAAEIPFVPIDKNEPFKPDLKNLPPVSTANIICPPSDAPIIGSKVEGNRVVSGYELQDNRCVTLYEDVPIVEQIVDALPTAGSVTTTASIALVATTSAVLAKPLADVILKAIKPLIKTVVKKIQKLLGKTPKRLTHSQVVSNLYREKKGLPALKVK